ncbi:hypothetical protein N9V56_05485, partial [Alphaproteobacteria bacterium]|nr:hypothetical protein [Alphaproteobacteria bacterium]
TKVELIYFHTYETEIAKKSEKIFSGENVIPSAIQSLNGLIEDITKLRTRHYSKGSIKYTRPDVRFAFSASSIDSINKVQEQIKIFSRFIKDLVNDDSKKGSGYGIGLNDVEQLFKSIDKHKETESVYKKILDNGIYIYSCIFTDWIMHLGKEKIPSPHYSTFTQETQSTSYVEKDIIGVLFGAKEVEYTFNIPSRDELIPSYAECNLKTLENYPYVFINGQQAKQFWEEEKQLEAALDEHINSLSDERRGK